MVQTIEGEKEEKEKEREEGEELHSRKVKQCKMSKTDLPRWFGIRIFTRLYAPSACTDGMLEYAELFRHARRF